MVVDGSVYHVQIRYDDTILNSSDILNPGVFIISSDNATSSPIGFGIRVSATKKLYRYDGTDGANNLVYVSHNVVDDNGQTVDLGDLGISDLGGTTAYDITWS